MPTVEIIFFAACAAVVIALIWLAVIAFRYREAAAKAKYECRAKGRRIDALNTEMQTLGQQCTDLSGQVESLQDANSALIAERNTAAAERDEIKDYKKGCDLQAAELIRQRDTAQQQLAAAKGQLSDLQGHHDKLKSHAETLESFCEGYKKENREQVKAHAARPVLSLATSPSQRGRHRVQLKDDADKVLLHSPAGYGSQEKADEVIERICGSRLEKAE